ncbi:hypothetical protein ASE98_25325 [Pseudomonas sp. Leaf48]|uniref:hypothetical protein n=1 Tax=Pseudomonas sp. Leaf48 TaxID=1736221 RepID=UPI000729C6DB|nr:hypothetical protein [Pseudomonas sp. Leaf48]KQN48079.1 hypothetical protein ASE98_25325 [Pseudomonas sp. Leaf48]
MKSISLLLVVLLCFVEEVNATSFGLLGEGKILAINNKPAICLPNDAGKNFSVGWISVSESYVRNAPGWAVALKSDAKPLVLQPGGCIEFGIVPDGYELYEGKIQIPSLKFEENKTYIFRLSEAYKTTDTYRAAFCVKKAVSGIFEYLQYERLPDGAEMTPVCGRGKHD